MPTALEQHRTQRMLDIAHHAGRIAWLEHPAPRWRCGKLVTGRERIEMLKASRAVLANPGLGTHTAAPPREACRAPDEHWMPPASMARRPHNRLVP